MKAQILFLTETINERVAKISYALKKRGITTSVVYKNIKHNQPFDYCFDFSRRVDSSYEAIEIVNRSTSDFVHLYSSFFDQFCLDLIQLGRKKIIYDAKDFFGGAYGDWINSTLPGQNYLIENSHALLYRDLQSTFTIGSMRLQKPKRRFFFPDYCWSTELLPRLKKDVNSRLKIAIIGNYLLDEGQEGLGLSLVLRKLIADEVDIDYYAFPHGRGNFSELVNLSNEHNNFRILNPLDPIELSLKLRQYDLGIHLCQFMHFPGLEDRTFQNPKAAHYGLSSRMFDFWGAGVPTLSSNLRFYRHFIRKYKIGLTLDGEIPSDLSSYLVRFGLPKCQSTVEISRFKELNIDSNIDKLINFYRSI